MRNLFISLFCCMVASLFCRANAQVGLFIRPNSSSLSSPVQGQTWLFNSTNNTMQVFNGSVFQIASAPQNNFTAVLAPTSSNDNTQGYSPASLWYNTDTGYTYQCVDATTSAAIWVQTNNLGSLSIPLTAIQQGGATTGQSLIWNGSQWSPSTQNIGLNNLLQTGAVVGQVPIWTGSAWVAGNPPGGSAGVPLSQLTQSGASSGQIISWNGSNWVAAAASGGGSTVSAQDTDFTAVGNYIYLVSIDSGPITCTLGNATSYQNQSITLSIVNNTGGTLTIATTAGQTINGVPPATLTTVASPNQSIVFTSDGANWFTTNNADLGLFGPTNSLPNCFTNDGAGDRAWTQGIPFAPAGPPIGNQVLIGNPGGTYGVYGWQFGNWGSNGAIATAATNTLYAGGETLNVADTTSNDVTFNLPTVASCSGQAFSFNNYAGTHNIILTPNGSETINGNATVTLTPGQVCTIQANSISARPDAWYYIVKPN